MTSNNNTNPIYYLCNSCGHVFDSSTTTYEVARFHLLLHNANITGYEDALNYFTKIINEEAIRINKVKEEEERIRREK